jgi:hypothetical protein
MHCKDGSKNEATLELKKDMVHSKLRYYVGSIPKKLQLARANIEFEVRVANTSKLNMLRVIRVPKPELGSLVKTFYYEGYILYKTGLPQQA